MNLIPGMKFDFLSGYYIYLGNNMWYETHMDKIYTYVIKNDEPGQWYNLDSWESAKQTILTEDELNILKLELI